MPELPEVETIRRQLSSVLVGRSIRSVDIRLPKMVRGNAAQVARSMRGATVRAVHRRGKYLFWELSRGLTVIVHLKMTGQIIYRRGKSMRVGGHPIPRGTEGLPNAYTHVLFQVSGGGIVYFNDQRQFGFVELVKTAQVPQYFQRLQMGPEPLGRGFSREYFTDLLARRRGTTIKQLLLDQTAIAGIGNIYAIESLFDARIAPTRRAGSLTTTEASALYRAIRRILPRAIAAQGTSADRYVDAHGAPGSYLPRLRMYGRGGQPCRRCGTVIRSLKIGGRGTTYCPMCQR